MVMGSGKEVVVHGVDELQTRFDQNVNVIGRQHALVPDSKAIAAA
jgi:hypothetical protein